MCALVTGVQTCALPISLIQPHDVYAIPPWIVPLVLDKAGEKLLNPPEGKGVVEGRMAFFDVLADARWGGIISGDKVQVEFDSGLDGVRTAIVRSEEHTSELQSLMRLSYAVSCSKKTQTNENRSAA